ncbi:MAG: helix-turn-helix domain-containing protein [Deltaproteobacteria bacterium]|nr:helix-turn-helix domain-containing protein [Deltaproteobacteria bacterium]
MAAANTLTTSPPHAVERSLLRLGADLRTARLRRGLTIKMVADKIGTGVRAVADAEKGKPTTAVVVYLALLWVYGLADDVDVLADPGRDAEGLALALSREPQRARRSDAGLDNDF